MLCHNYGLDAVTVFWSAFAELDFDSDRAKFIKLFLSDHFVNASQARHLLAAISKIDQHKDLVTL